VSGPAGGKTTTIKLTDEEDKIGNATATSMYADMIFRGIMVLVVSGIFIWLNHNVMSFIYQAFEQDKVAMLHATHPMAPADRLISPTVVTALIGATVVQTGIGFIAITSYLFPKRLR
jgi:hypothetical protein